MFSNDGFPLVAYSSRPSPGHPLFDVPYGVALGVGQSPNDPDSVSSMWRANMTGTHNDRRREGVARRLQLVANPVEAVRLKRNETKNVFCQHPPRCDLPHEAQEVGPKPAIVRCAVSSSGD